MSAAKRIAAFNWDKVLKRYPDAETQKALLSLRSKANEILSQSATKPVSAIDFKAFANQTNHGSAGVSALEKAFSTRNLPKYTASVAPIITEKRAAVIAIGSTVTAAAQAELAILQEQYDKSAQLSSLDIDGVQDWFPHLAKEAEDELMAFDFEPNTKRGSDKPNADDWELHF